MDSFDKVIGYESVKSELRRIADMLKNIDFYKQLGVSIPSGMLLHGDPGLGKTFMSKCLIEESGLPAFTCRKAEGEGKFVDTIRSAFEEAAANAPAIVFLDDMDKFSNVDPDHRNSDEFVAIQTCIDEVKGKGVFVLATVNERHNLPRSLMRAGRFDQIVELQAPQGGDAVKIVEHYLSNMNLGDDIDFELVANLVSGRSCAVLETVVNEAGMLAGYERADAIEMRHVVDACLSSVHHIPPACLRNRKHVDITVPSSESIYIWHEAGHAAVSELLRPGSVSLMFACCSDEQQTGFMTTSSEPNTATHLEVFTQRVMTSLAGIAAVELQFGLSCEGGGADLDKAYDIIMNMLTKGCAYGMDLVMPSRWSDSYAKIERLEVATSVLLSRYREEARALLCENRGFLAAIAEALSEKGLLTVQDILDIRSRGH